MKGRNRIVQLLSCWAFSLVVVGASSEPGRVGTRSWFDITDRTQPLSAQFVKRSEAVWSVPRGGAVSSVKRSDEPKLPTSKEKLQFYVRMGMLLAFNSGYMNGCCLGGYMVAVTKTATKAATTAVVAAAQPKRQSVAAMTGAYTTMALALASSSSKQDINFWKQQLMVLGSYISGSAIAGALDPKPVAYNLASRCDVTLFICSILLLLATAIAKGAINVGATAGGPVGAGSSAAASASTWFTNSLATFCLAAMVNGIQNSLTSTHTQNLIRTTHFTGISSDMGTFIGQALAGNRENIWKLKIFAALAGCFWLGGFLSFYVATELSPDNDGTGLLLASAALYAFLAFQFRTKENGTNGFRRKTNRSWGRRNNKAPRYRQASYSSASYSGASFGSEPRFSLPKLGNVAGTGNVGAEELQDCYADNGKRKKGGFFEDSP